MNTPKILAPAGDQSSFLAAIAAGADAIYCGLKIFSARMEADNFSIEQLSALTQLAKSRHIDVYIAFNSIIKESELTKVFKILSKLCCFVDFDALIIQDPALIPLARKAGFNKQLHLSTLGNCTFSSGLKTLKKFGFTKVVLPREFTIDEIKETALNTPDDIELEVFVHGALCYCISGRCYWSSWFGGKSSLRGRCVQPCRRIYEQKGHKRRHFSCMDFSADVLAKILKQIPRVTTWKIEGRKKSPHYVYYTIKAYQMLRDNPEKKKTALAFLDYAMGRQFTHYNLLSQRKINPLNHSSETGSGLFAGRVRDPASPFFIAREALFALDLLRIGFEDDGFHDIQKVTRAVPKRGKFYLNKKSKFKIRKGTPVYIIDRRNSELSTLIKSLETELSNIKAPIVRPIKKEFKNTFSRKPNQIKNSIKMMHLVRGRGNQRNPAGKTDSAVWISNQGYSVPPSGGNWLWLDPVLFPGEEKKCSNYIARAIKKGARNFVLNAAWQLSFFKNPESLNLWAGPFCNITNSVTINLLKQHGICGAIVSPELDQETLLALPKMTGIPLGVVIYGNWPLGISRIISDDLKINQAFKSPKGETAWVSKHNSNYFIFPNWILDLTAKKEILKKAGFYFFIYIHETIPRDIKMKNRPGLWNWNLKLL